MNDLITIILPVYNLEKYIKDTIDSIKKQTYPNWELIIVDDASIDNSNCIIKQCIKEIKNKTTLIELKENCGVSNARNVAVENAKGKFIAYIDGDDLWKEDKLETQVKFMKKYNIAFSYTLFYYYKNKRKRKAKLIPKEMNYKKALKNTCILTSTVMIDISKINKQLLKMPNVKRGQDTATWWQILKNGHNAYLVKENLSLYRRENEKSLSKQKITSLKRTWNLYRKVEKKSILKSIYYFTCYAINATLRRI